MADRQAGAGQPPRTRLHCPCGEWLEGSSEDELVALASEHLLQRHPQLDYTREEILFMAF